MVTVQAQTNQNKDHRLNRKLWSNLIDHSSAYLDDLNIATASLNENIALTILKRTNL